MGGVLSTEYSLQSLEFSSCYLHSTLYGNRGKLFLKIKQQLRHIKIWLEGRYNESTYIKYLNFKGRPLQLMDKVFGTNRWAWLLPITPAIKVNTLELLYYEVEVAGDKKGKGSYSFILLLMEIIEIYEEDKFKEMPIYHKYFM